MWYVRDVLYAVLYVRVSCFVVRGCAVTDAVNMAVKDQKNNIVLDDLLHPINASEKDLTRKDAPLSHS